MGRKRFNAAAICSSDNYISSKRAHVAFLQRTHERFISLIESGELELVETTVEIKPAFVIVMVFGRELKLSYEDYLSHCPEFKIIKTLF